MDADDHTPGLRGWLDRQLAADDARAQAAPDDGPVAALLRETDARRRLFARHDDDIDRVLALAYRNRPGYHEDWRP
jgi:hypothetical protein